MATAIDTTKLRPAIHTAMIASAQRHEAQCSQRLRSERCHGPVVSELERLGDASDSSRPFVDFLRLILDDVRSFLDRLEPLSITETTPARKIDGFEDLSKPGKGCEQQQSDRDRVDRQLRLGDMKDQYAGRGDRHNQAYAGRAIQLPRGPISLVPVFAVGRSTHGRNHCAWPRRAAFPTDASPRDGGPVIDLVTCHLTCAAARPGGAFATRDENLRARYVLPLRTAEAITVRH
jgi:hypothetical protein